MIWYYIITAVLACIGAFLGIINTIYNIHQNRFKLKIIPSLSVKVYNKKVDKIENLCIQIINLSNYPVTVSQVGFLLTSGEYTHGMIMAPITYDNKPWPRRLESREAVRVYYGRGLKDINIVKEAKKIYVDTECGRRVYGRGPALQAYINNILEISNLMNNNENKHS